MDRLLGFFVGAAKIFLVLAILAAIVSKISVLNQKISPFFEGSKVYPILLSAGQFIMAMDVSKVKESVESGQIVVPELLDSVEGVEENLTKVEQ